MKKQFKIFYTSDTHGAVFQNSTDEKPDGLLQCIHQFHKDGNTLILDGGDTIQGSPISKYLWEHHEFEEVIPYVFNSAAYDYYTLGNHDFNYGYEGLTKYINSMKAKCLAANVFDETDTLSILPYTIHTLENGLRIGICGIVTDCVNLWESKENLKHLKITEGILAAKKVYEEILDHCDFTICVYHGGFECDLDSGIRLTEGNENIGYEICKELNYDLLLTAHQHMEIQGRYLFGTYTLQVPANAVKYARIVVEEENGKFQITSDLLTPKGDYSKSLMEYLSPIKKKVDYWLSTPVGTLKTPIPPTPLLERAIKGSKLADLANMVQLAETGADISCAGLSNTILSIDKEVSLNDVLEMFPFANATVVLEVKGEILKMALERCASYFELLDGEVIISDRFIKPKEEHYNYDYYAGVTYTINLKAPVGERVSNVKVKGKPLDNSTYQLAMSNYRTTGTGGYDFFRKCKITYVSKTDFQQSVIWYLKHHSELIIPDMGGIELKGYSFIK